MYIYRVICISIVLSFLLTFTAQADESITIVVNKDVPVGQLTKKSLKNIYLGKEPVWKNNEAIRLVIMPKSEIHKYFVKKVTRKSTRQFRAYWKNMVFTGKSTAPKSFSTENKLIDYVAKTSGSIGYISNRETVADFSGIKILVVSE